MAEDTGHATDDSVCDCDSNALKIGMRGLEHTAICAPHRQDRGISSEEELDPILYNICSSMEDADIVENVVRNIRFARTTTVTTSRCGAGKFLATLLPIVDVALKIKKPWVHFDSSTSSNGFQSRAVFSPTILIVEPDGYSGRQTTHLLSDLVAEYDLGLEIVSFIDGTPEPTSDTCAGDITICTPGRAQRMLSSGALNLDTVRLLFWDSVDDLLMRFNGPELDVEARLSDAHALFAAAKRAAYGMGFIFSVQHSSPEVLFLISSNISSFSPIESNITLSVPVSYEHHWTNDFDVCTWEAATTTASSSELTATGHSSLPPVSFPTTTASRSPTITFPFVNLPLEIRKAIYKYLLIEDDPIGVTTFKTRLGSGRMISASVSGPVRDRSNYCWYAIREAAFTGVSTPFARNKFAIAKVDRQLAAEALPYVYRYNRFRFDNISDMNTFFLEIDKNRKHVRSIQVLDPSPRSLRMEHWRA